MGRVTSVLLHDGWHSVLEDSFKLGETVFYGEPGFLFQDVSTGKWMSGPTAALFAVAGAQD